MLPKVPKVETLGVDCNVIQALHKLLLWGDSYRQQRKCKFRAVTDLKCPM